jgi:hypothetical protein
MASTGPGFVVLYRWRLREGAEQAFTDAWSQVSGLLRAQRGSLGSRLHRGSDGIWYSYAQWPDAETRERSVLAGPVDPEASRKMRDAAAEELPDIVLTSVADFMLLPVEVRVLP